MPKVKYEKAKGLYQVGGAGYEINSIDLVPNDIATTLLGLNPTWRLNFGGATLAAGNNTSNTHILDVLTPVNTLFKLSQALEVVAAQPSGITAAQAGQIFGETANAGSVQDMTGAATSVDVIPATETPITLRGRLDANLTLADSSTDFGTKDDQAIIVFNDLILAHGVVFKICTHADSELLNTSSEVVVTGDGTSALTRVTVPSATDRDIILTATGTGSGDVTILAGSYLYMQAGNATDQVALKGCIRTSGGTIAVTFAS